MEQLGWKGCSEQGCDGEENFELQDSGIHSLLCKSLQVCLSFELRLKISRKQNLIQRENLSGKLKRCILGSQHGFGLTIHGVVMSFRILFAKKKKRKKKYQLSPPKPYMVLNILLFLCEPKRRSFPSLPGFVIGQIK